MDYVVVFLLFASVSGSPMNEYWLRNYVCLHFMKCKSQPRADGLSGKPSTGSPSEGSATERTSHSVSSSEFTANMVPTPSSSQSWLQESSSLTSHLETSAGDAGSGTIDTSGLASSSSFVESQPKRLSHLISPPELTENAFRADPKRSTLPESSTLIIPHLETSTYITQSRTSILETAFKTLSESDILVDPEDDAGGNDTLIHVDHSLSPSPEYTVMDKTIVPVHPTSMFPLIQSSHMSVGYTSIIRPGSMSSVQSSETLSTTKLANMEMPITSAEHLTSAPSSVLQIAASSTHHRHLDTTTPRNPYPVRVVKQVCRCSCRNIQRLEVLTSEAVVAIKVNIQSELLVDKANLSRLIQKKVSAPDVRPSASGIGYLGLVLLSLPFLLIVFSDARTTITLLFSTYKTLRQSYLS